MSNYVIPQREPKEIDEKVSMELRILSSNAGLKGRPSGNDWCDNCRLLPRGRWWCDRRRDRGRYRGACQQEGRSFRRARCFPVTESGPVGWYIYGNERMVLAADKSTLTWWASAPAAYHPQYRRFWGFV